MTSLTGIVLAAGAGSRMGKPKAMLSSADGRPWLETAIALLRTAGCDPVLAVLGAAIIDVPAGVVAVIASDWELGLSASLCAGLNASSGDAVLVSLVDLPDLPLEALLRVSCEPIGTTTLRQAVYEGRPGHPVLIGRDHWAGVTASISGDRGAREFLVANGVQKIECGDLFDGHDIDH